MNTPSSIALWRQLKASADVVAAVRAGHSATQAMLDVESVLRPGVQALSFHALRHLGTAQALRQRLAPRPPAPWVDALLCTVLALASAPEAQTYTPFTLVDQAVEAAKRHPRARSQAGFVNACLRRFLREQEALMASVAADPLARWNHPAWWVKRLQADHPDHWQALLDHARRPAPMSLRIHQGRTTLTETLAALQAAGIEAKAVPPVGIELARPVPVPQLPGFAEGRISVQDGAAQLAAPLLLDGLVSDRPLRVLDACAAPGGKTAHLLETGRCEVTALDVDANRCTRIHENLRRLGLQAKVLTADAADPPAWWDGQPFDAILLDAPCTASGIVRRHPDVVWLRRPTDVEQLAAIQARLLQVLWPLLRVGGRLLYATCSVFKAEGADQVQAFLAHNSDAAFLPSPGHLIPGAAPLQGVLPDNGASDHDGFFYALLEKRAL